MKKIALAAAVMMGLSSSAFAEGHKFSLSLLPGVAIPMSGAWKSSGGENGSLYDDGHRASFATALAADYQAMDNVALGLEFARNWKHKIKDAPDQCSGGATSIMQITPYVRVFKKMDKLTPYGILGVGYYRVKTDELFYNALQDNTQPYGKGAYSYLGFNIGLGATYEIVKDLELGLDLRWHHVFSNLSVYTNVIRGESYVLSAINNFAPSLKVQYNFSI